MTSEQQCDNSSSTVAVATNPATATLTSPTVPLFSPQLPHGSFTLQSTGGESTPSAFPSIPSSAASTPRSTTTTATFLTPSTKPGLLPIRHGLPRSPPSQPGSMMHSPPGTTPGALTSQPTTLPGSFPLSISQILAATPSRPAPVPAPSVAALLAAPITQTTASRDGGAAPRSSTQAHTPALPPYQLPSSCLAQLQNLAATNFNPLATSPLSQFSQLSQRERDNLLQLASLYPVGLLSPLTGGGAAAVAHTPAAIPSFLTSPQSGSIAPALPTPTQQQHTIVNSLPPLLTSRSELPRSAVPPGVAPSQHNSHGLHFPPHFRRNSMIRLASGQIKAVETLSTEDFIQSAKVCGDFCLDTVSVLQIKKTAGTAQDGEPATVLLTFSVGRSRTKVDVEATREHPFFVYARGWSSVSPAHSLRTFGLDCQPLRVGDRCISLTHKDSAPAAPPLMTHSPLNTKPPIQSDHSMPESRANQRPPAGQSPESANQQRPSSLNVELLRRDALRPRSNSNPARKRKTAPVQLVKEDPGDHRPTSHRTSLTAPDDRTATATEVSPPSPPVFQFPAVQHIHSSRSQREGDAASPSPTDGGGGSDTPSKPPLGDTPRRRLVRESAATDSPAPHPKLSKTSSDPVDSKSFAVTSPGADSSPPDLSTDDDVEMMTQRAVDVTSLHSPDLGDPPHLEFAESAPAQLLSSDVTGHSIQPPQTASSSDVMVRSAGSMDGNNNSDNIDDKRPQSLG